MKKILNIWVPSINGAYPLKFENVTDFGLYGTTIQFGYDDLSIGKQYSALFEQSKILGYTLEEGAEE